MSLTFLSGSYFKNFPLHRHSNAFEILPSRNIKTRRSRVERVIGWQTYQRLECLISIDNNFHTISNSRSHQCRHICGNVSAKILDLIIQIIVPESVSDLSEGFDLGRVFALGYSIASTGYCTYRVAWTAFVIFSEFASTIFSFLSKNSFVSLGFFST